MRGHLDSDNQAFLTIDAGQGPLDFLVDTGFNGSLIIGIGTALLDPHQLEIDYGNRRVELTQGANW